MGSELGLNRFMAACLLAACATTATSAIALAQGFGQGQPTTVAQANFSGGNIAGIKLKAHSGSSRPQSARIWSSSRAILQPAADRRLAEGAFRHRSVRRRDPPPRRQYPCRQCGRKPDHQPDRLRRQQADRRRRPGARSPASSPRRLYAHPRPERRSACWKSTAAAAGSQRRSSRRSSNSTRTGWIWFSRSMRAPVPASARSTSSATRCSATASCGRDPDPRVALVPFPDDRRYL